MPDQKTYWHLLEQRRIPSEYELASSNLHYYRTHGGFELELPLAKWYQQYQTESPFLCSNWDKFYDPRETTYTKYTGIQTRKEIFVDGVFELIETSGYDKSLQQDYVVLLEQFLPTLRFPLHGFQMLASYIGHMAPGSRITIAAMFQAADEMRHIQRIAYRIGQLQLSHPGFAHNSKLLWQNDPMWQPLREALERLLVTYDWGESFVALNLVLKPLVDELIFVQLGKLAAGCGDYALQEIFASLNQDCLWHRQWSRSLIQTALHDCPANIAVLECWIRKWYPLVLSAVQSFGQLFDRATPATQGACAQYPTAVSMLAELQESYEGYLLECGLRGALSGVHTDRSPARSAASDHTVEMPCQTTSPEGESA